MDMEKDKTGTNLNVIHYVEYDAQTLMKFIEHGEQGNNALLELLKGILEKCFTLMFSLNGGAAVACLAFLGNVITKDFYFWEFAAQWIRWALVWFSLGAGSVVLSAMISYISQCYFCESLGISIANSREALKLKNEFSQGRIVDENYISWCKKSASLHAFGQWCRLGAILCAVCSLVLFGTGVYCFYCAFGRL